MVREVVERVVAGESSTPFGYTNAASMPTDTAVDLDSLARLHAEMMGRRNDLDDCIASALSSLANSLDCPEYGINGVELLSKMLGVDWEELFRTIRRERPASSSMWAAVSKFVASAEAANSKTRHSAN